MEFSRYKTNSSWLTQKTTNSGMSAVEKNTYGILFYMRCNIGPHIIVTKIRWMMMIEWNPYINTEPQRNWSEQRMFKARTNVPMVVAM